jgi:hypothetical protein
MNNEVSRSQSFEEKLNSSDWKVRLEAYEEFLTKIPQEKESLTSRFKDLFPRFLTENTPSAMEKGLMVVAQCLIDDQGNSHIRRIAQSLDSKSLTKNLVEKIFAANRPNLSAIANKLLCTIYEVSDRSIIGETLNDLVSNKNPKVAIASLSALKELLVNLGPKECQWQMHYQKVLPKCSDANPAVRTASMDYLKELGRFQGDSLLSLFKSLKPVQITEIKTYVDSNPRATPLKAFQHLPVSDMASDKCQDMQRMDQEDIWEQIEGTKVLQKYSEAWTEKLLSDPKWNEKKEKLEAMEKSLDVVKIEPANYTHIVKMLKKLLSDSNIAVHMAALGVIKKLCKGLRGKFAAGVKTLNRALLQKLKERKPLVTDNVIETITAGFQCCGVDEMTDEYRDQLKERNPQIKCNIMRILNLYVSHAGPRCLKNPAFGKFLVACAKENMNDGSPEVRKASLTIYSTLMTVAPTDPFLVKEVGILDEKRRAKIAELIKDPKGGSLVGSNGLQASPNQEKFAETSSNKNTLKKSQSVTKFMVPNEASTTLNGKKSVPQISTSKSQIVRPSQGHLISKPGVAINPQMKKSQSSANLSSQPTLSNLLDEMKNPIGHEEASMYLQKECGIPTEKINQLSHSNWKLRQQALQWFKEKLSSNFSVDLQDSAFEAVMVLVKKTTNDFKESNINIVKDIVELGASLSNTSSSKTIYLIVELLLEKLPMNKWEDQARVAFQNITQNHGLRKLATCILGNSKDKTANPKLVSSTLGLMKKLTLQSPEKSSSLPYREMVSFCKGALMNPNTGVRHSSLELLAVLISFNKDVSSLISDISTVQKNMINEEICKLNTQLNTGSQKDLSQALIASIVQDDDSRNQVINLQLMLDNFKQKKAALTDDQRDQLLDFLEDNLARNQLQTRDLMLELLPFLCRKYKKEFEKKAASYIRQISVFLLQEPESDMALTSLRSIFDCLGGSVFARIDQFDNLDRKVKNQVMRIADLETDNIPFNCKSLELVGPHMINVIKEPELMNLEDRPDILELSPAATKKGEEGHNKTNESPLIKNSAILSPRLFKTLQSPNQSTIPKPYSQEDHTKIANELDRSLSPKPLSDLSDKKSGRKSRLASGMDKELTFEDIGDNLSWKEHKLDMREPKDSEIKELKRLIRTEMGDDLHQLMFSYEKGKVIEAIQKVETRMKQKSELSGFWEIMLKWALIRVFDCSREDILREFGRLVVKLINFSDRGGRRLTAEEAKLFFSIQVFIAANEEESQLNTFASTYGYNLITEHREILTDFIVKLITPEPFKRSHLRSLAKSLDLVVRFIAKTEPELSRIDLHRLEAIAAEETPDILLRLKELVGYIISKADENERLTLAELQGKVGDLFRFELKRLHGESHPVVADKSCSFEENVSQNKPQILSFIQFDGQTSAFNSKIDVNYQESESLKELRSEIQAVAKNHPTKNILILKKIVELTKTRTFETDSFIKFNYLSIVEMMCYLLDSTLRNRASFKDRIVAVQDNFEAVRTTLEYVQKLCGNPIILAALTQTQFTQLFTMFIECLVVVEADRKYLEENLEDLYTDRSMKIRETIGKFLNSAILRLLDGPINIVFASLFCLLMSFASLPPHFDRDSSQNRLKIVAKNLLRVSKTIDSNMHNLNLMKILGYCAEYLNRFSPPKQVEEEDLGVNTIKTLLTDICRCYKTKTLTHLQQLERKQHGFEIVQKWVSLLVGDPLTSEIVVSSIEGTPYTNKEQPAVAELPKNPAESSQPRENYQKRSPITSTNSAFQQTTVAPALVGNSPLQDRIPLPTPGMPFRPVATMASPIRAGIPTPKIAIDIESSPRSLDLGEESSRSKPMPIEVHVSEPKPSPPEAQIHESQPRNPPKQSLYSLQKSSVSDYSQYKESFLRSSLEKDSVSELHMIEEIPSQVHEVDSSSKSNKQAFQSFGMKSEASVKSVNLEEVSKPSLVQPVKFMPVDVASLGKRSAVEKQPLDEQVVDMYSPGKILKKKSLQGSGKFSLNLKDPKSSNENSASSRKNIEARFSPSPSNQKQYSHLSPHMEGQRILFSKNMIASNVNTSVNNGLNLTSSATKMSEHKLKMKHDLMPMKDQSLVDLIVQFKKSMLVDYKHNAKEINDYLLGLPREHRPALGEYLTDLSIVQKSYLMNELAQPESQTRAESDENLAENFNTIYERLSQIRQKYQRPTSEVDTPPLNAETVIESLEYKAREKRIDDFRQKIQTLLRHKFNSESN